VESEGKNVPGAVTVCVEFKAVDEVIQNIFKIKILQEIKESHQFLNFFLPLKLKVQLNFLNQYVFQHLKLKSFMFNLCMYYKLI